MNPTASPPERPELLAVVKRIRGGETLNEIVVVKRGGDPVHISEVLPEVLDNLLPKPAA